MLTKYQDLPINITHTILLEMEPYYKVPHQQI